MTTYTLPWPPSVNGYWRSFRNRQIISKRGREFRENAIAAVLEQGRTRTLGRLSVLFRAYPPDRRIRDLDNFIKATADALSHAGVWSDDSQIDDLRIVRGECVKGGKMVVEIKEIAE